MKGGFELDVHMQKNDIGALIHTNSKTKSNWIKYLNLKAKTTQVLGENIGINDLGLNGFLDMTPKVQAK